MSLYKYSGKWAAKFKRRHLGYFDVEEDADRAYEIAAREGSQI
jgi:hypothetical protein